ncbi:MAG: hypothetical protein ACPG7U_01045 [Holosporaceae bacterium]
MYLLLFLLASSPACDEHDRTFFPNSPTRSAIETDWDKMMGEGSANPGPSPLSINLFSETKRQPWSQKSISTSAESKKSVIQKPCRGDVAQKVQYAETQSLEGSVTVPFLLTESWKGMRPRSRSLGARPNFLDLKITIEKEPPLNFANQVKPPQIKEAQVLSDCKYVKEFVVKKMLQAPKIPVSFLHPQMAKPLPRRAEKTLPRTSMPSTLASVSSNPSVCDTAKQIAGVPAASPSLDVPVERVMNTRSTKQSKDVAHVMLPPALDTKAFGLSQMPRKKYQAPVNTLRPFKRVSVTPPTVRQRRRRFYSDFEGARVRLKSDTKGFVYDMYTTVVQPRLRHYSQKTRAFLDRRQHSFQTSKKRLFKVHLSSLPFGARKQNFESKPLFKVVSLQAERCASFLQKKGLYQKVLLFKKTLVALLAALSWGALQAVPLLLLKRFL